jgi:hypothetical protein
MDSITFDSLTRAFTTTRSRRGFMRFLGPVVFAGASVPGGLTETEARKGGKGKGKKKRRRTPSCTPSCERRICGDDGCGGTCGACPAGFTCAGGRCECLSPRALVCGGCIDLLTDLQHCGQCGAACGGAEAVCEHGNCCTSPGSRCRCTPAGSACDAETCCMNGGPGACLLGGICP